MEARAGTTRHRRRRRGEGGAENEANRSLTKMQSNGCRNGASGEWAARRGSRKKSEAVGAPGCVEIVRAAYALFAIEKAEFVSAGGRPIPFALLDSHAFRRFSNLRFVNDWLGTLEVCSLLLRVFASGLLLQGSCFRVVASGTQNATKHTNNS